MKVLDSGLGVACWLTLVMVSTGSITFGEDSTGFTVDTTPLRIIEQRCLPLELVPGSARCDSLPAYYWAANRELHYSFQRAQKIWEAGCPWPYRAVTLVAGSAGVGKTFIKGEVFHETCPATAVCELDIRDLYAEWEEQGLVEPRPDLFDGDVVLSRLPALVDRGKPLLVDFLESQRAAFYVIDSLDEIHPDDTTWVLEQVEEFAFHRDHRFVHAVVFGRPVAFRDYWQSKYWHSRPESDGQIALFTLKPPRFRTTGDLLISSWNYHSWKYKLKWAPHGGEPTAMPLEVYSDWIDNGFSRSFRFASVSLVPNGNTSSEVHQTLLNWAQQRRVVCSVLRNLAGNSIIREIAESHARSGRSYDDRAVMDAFLNAWLERDTKSSDRPSTLKPQHLDLYLRLLERTAAKYVKEGRVNEDGYFSVDEEDYLAVENAGRDLKFSVKQLLDRSGLTYLDPREPGAAKYRFEPLWLHRLLVENHNQRLGLSATLLGPFASSD